MKTLRTLATAIAIIAGAPGALEAKIVFPPDASLLRGDGKIEVLAFRPAAAGPGKLAVAQQGASREFAVAPGVVRVKLTMQPGNGSLQLDGEAVRFFLEGAGAGAAPAGFEIPDAHAAGIGCEDCHTIGKEQAPLLEPGGKLCLRCHEDVTKVAGQEPVVHPPAGEGDCFACHRPHGAAIRQLSAAGRLALCLDCHKDQNLGPSGAKWATPHAPVAKGMCTDCHDPHAAASRSLLARPGNQICLGCHEEPHALHRFVKDDWPLANNVKIPEGFPISRAGEFGCGGCHLPHGSDNKRLWVRNEDVLCRACHKKKR